ncbi:MAG: heme exporter protein CcmD [Hyphomicrobiaceae bacterium]
MFDFGKHAIFIWSSYGAVVIVLFGLVIRLIADGRRYRRQLDDFEARGIRRRSDAE